MKGNYVSRCVRWMNEKVRFVVQSALIANTARRTKRRGMKGRHRCVVMFSNERPCWYAHENMDNRGGQSWYWFIGADISFNCTLQIIPHQLSAHISCTASTSCPYMVNSPNETQENISRIQLRVCPLENCTCGSFLKMLDRCYESPSRHSFLSSYQVTDGFRLCKHPAERLMGNTW